VFSPRCSPSVKEDTTQGSYQHVLLTETTLPGRSRESQVNEGLGRSKRVESNLGHLQDNQLARPPQRYDGEEGEADDEAGERPEVASPKDQQTIPPAHYVSPVSLWALSYA
jgi:hypothetical protein